MQQAISAITIVQHSSQLANPAHWLALLLNWRLIANALALIICFIQAASQLHLFFVCHLCLYYHNQVSLRSCILLMHICQYVATIQMAV